MKRTLSETGFSNEGEANKKSRINDLDTTVVAIGFESVPQDILNTILDLFDDTKDIKALSLTCSQLQNRIRTFWESTTSALVTLRSEPFSLNQKQLISQRVINLKREHGGRVPFKLLDYSNLNPVLAADKPQQEKEEKDEEEKEEEDTYDSEDYKGQFGPIAVKFLPWDPTRFVLLTCAKLAVFSIGSTTPLYQQNFNASAFNDVVFCKKTRSVGALVRLASGSKVYILHDDDNGGISLVRTIMLEKKRKGKASKATESSRGRSVPGTGRGKPSRQAVIEGDHGEDNNGEEGEQEDENDEGVEEEENKQHEDEELDDGGGEGEDEEDADDENQEEEDEDYETPKFRKTGYQNFVMGDKYVTVSQQVNIKQYSATTGKLLKTEKFCESGVLEQVHQMQYLEFFTVDLSPDGSKAYAWSSQHYFDAGPLYELDIETGTYRIKFQADDCFYDKYPSIKFLNDGQFMKIESQGTNSSVWYAIRNEPPYPVVGEFSDDCCGGTAEISHDISTLLFYNYGDIKIQKLEAPNPNDEDNERQLVTLKYGEVMGTAEDEQDLITFRWHPTNSSVFFGVSGGKVSAVALIENEQPEVIFQADQPYSNSFWFLQDLTCYEGDKNIKGNGKSSHIRLLFTDENQNTICWDLTLDLTFFENEA